MDSILIIIAISLAIASVINIVLTKFAISHIVGYIITGTIISNLFGFNGNGGISSLELIGEFGIVFLMFTIGLEMSFSKLKKHRKIIFINGFMQVVISSIVIFLITFYIARLDSTSSIIIALAFSLSSTAIVVTYLKKSKDIVTPYGEKSVAILIFQDLAVIPILLLIGFLAKEGLSVADILLKTFFYACLVILFMFTLGKKIIEFLLKFSSRARTEEMFLGSVLTIVLGASLIAHEMGFTYSLGAFIAGMIIAESQFHVKVESDIASYKDLLLGAFFFSIGTKIDVFYFLSNLHYVAIVLMLTMLVKGSVVYFLIRKQSNKSDAIKSALAICQVGEFSFAIFALAANQHLLSQNVSSFLILVAVLSMIITPFMVNHIYKLAALFVTEYFEVDKITPVTVEHHTIICGFHTLGRLVARELSSKNKKFIIISNNLQHVQIARRRGYEAYFGHLDKLPVLESLKVEVSSSIIVTVDSLKNIKLICESVLDYYPQANLVVKINTIDDKVMLSNIAIKSFVHAQYETAMLLVKNSEAEVEPKVVTA